MKRLQQEREARGLSKSKLARLAELNPATITLIENRGFQPYPGQLRKLAKALGISEQRAHTLLEEVTENAGQQ